MGQFLFAVRVHPCTSVVNLRFASALLRVLCGLINYAR